MVMMEQEELRSRKMEAMSRYFEAKFGKRKKGKKGKGKKGKKKWFLTHKPDRGELCVFSDEAHAVKCE